MEKRLSRDTEAHRNEIKLRRKEKEKRETVRKSQEKSETDGMKYWREKFHEMAVNSERRNWNIRGTKEHVDRI